MVVLGKAYNVRAEAENEISAACAAAVAVETKECFFEGGVL
jgi:hypothetical protein